ncbi:hypothetical protein [Nitrosomonas sp. Is37]|uniref:hypothetical protein n=1 Tax=Nitrosomonas sp. Is37 TaxID=3080535 RepID=UPI00294A9F06|nr:hypothetical protein [Nitrosomonas sp. Is37]MDV6344015.1 hypothetical protein [Nitrosomonas sp. Is37]
MAQDTPKFQKEYSAKLPVLTSLTNLRWSFFFYEYSSDKATTLTTPCGESLWGSCHRGGTFKNGGLSLICYAGSVGRSPSKFNSRLLVNSLRSVITAVYSGKLFESLFSGVSIHLTTHPLQGHLFGFCLGRKNRISGGFFIFAENIAATLSALQGNAQPWRLFSAYKKAV